VDDVRASGNEFGTEIVVGLLETSKESNRETGGKEAGF
jgi:hypothetical protein